MGSQVRLIECVREEWERLPGKVPSEVKADYLRVLVAAGLGRIDAVSFVAKEAVPSMTDAELVLEYMDPPDDVEVIGLVLDAEGAERAATTGAVQAVRFPYSLSAEYLRGTQGRGLEEALEAMEGVGEVAYKRGMELIATVTMAFGNLSGDPWDIEEVVAACDLLVDSGVRRITLADTAGLATPRLVAEAVADTRAVHEAVEIGVHLRGRPEMAPELIEAAYAAGCRSFEGVIGGTGGGSLGLAAGTMATEVLVAELKRLGAGVPELRPIDGLVAASAEIVRRYGPRVQ